MRRITSYLILVSLALFMAVCSVSATPIVNVTAGFSGPTGGLYTYSYSIAVEPSSLESVWEFWLYPSVAFANILTPTGWEMWSTDNLSFIQWISTSLTGDTPTNDITPGGSLSGFSYQSAEIQSIIDYEAGASTYDPENPLVTGVPLGEDEYAGGTITIPVSPGPGPEPIIPEPSTILLLSGGLAGLLAYVRVRKRH